jgi:hypothetical protein
MQLTLPRSHKVTAAGLQQLLAAGHLQQLTVIRCRGVSQDSLRQLKRQYPSVSIKVDRPKDRTDWTSFL